MATLSALQDRQESMHNSLQQSINDLSGRIDRSTHFQQSRYNYPNQNFPPRYTNFQRQNPRATQWNNQGYGQSVYQKPRDFQRNPRSQHLQPPSNQGYRLDNRPFNSPHPNRKQNFCRNCGNFGHMQSQCPEQSQQRTPRQSVPYNTLPKN